MKAIKTIMVIALLGFFAIAAQAQLSAPFAEGISLQQYGTANQSIRVAMEAKQMFDANDFTSRCMRDPGLNSILKCTNAAAASGVGSISGNRVVKGKAPIRNAKISMKDMNHALIDVQKNADEARAEMRLTSRLLTRRRNLKFQLVDKAN